MNLITNLLFFIVFFEENIQFNSNNIATIAINKDFNLLLV